MGTVEILRQDKAKVTKRFGQAKIGEYFALHGELYRKISDCNEIDKGNNTWSVNGSVTVFVTGDTIIDCVDVEISWCLESPSHNQPGPHKPRPGDIMGVCGVATKLGVQPATVYNWRRCGLIDSLDDVKPLRFDFADVQRRLATRHTCQVGNSATL